MRLLNDLRFFIGLFFFMIGFILVIVGVTNPSLQAGVNLNLITGVCFVIFSAIALALAFRELKKP